MPGRDEENLRKGGGTMSVQSMENTTKRKDSNPERIAVHHVDVHVGTWDSNNAKCAIENNEESRRRLRETLLDRRTGSF